MTKTGSWLRVHPSKIKGTELGAQKWQDALFLKYGIEPPDLPKLCDGCNAALSICHALDFKKGDLIRVRHKKLRDKVADLAGKAFTPIYMRDDPLFFTGHAVQRSKSQTAENKLST